MFQRVTIAVALFALTFCVTVASADDQADIRTSAKSFAKALVDGDAGAAKHYSVNDTTSEKALDLMAELTKARKSLIDAAVAKFGDEGKNVTLGGANESRQEALGTDLDNAIIDVHGDNATARSKDGNDARPVYFKKEASVWKMDLTKLANFASVTQRGTQMHMISSAYSSTSAEIRDGKYKTAQEAKMAVREKIVAAAGRRGRGG